MYLRTKMNSALRLAITVAGFGLWSSQANAASDYTLEPCCDLCPEALSSASYDSKYLSFFRTLVPGENDWLYRTENDLRTEFGTDEAGYRGLKQLNAALKAKGVDLVIVYQPTRGLMNPENLYAGDRKNFNSALAKNNYTHALESFRSAGIHTPDLSRLFDASFSQDYFFRGDHHWTPYGAARTAEIVAESIKTLPSFSEIPSVRFVTKQEGLLGKRGTLHKAAAQICGHGYADQYVGKLVTEPAEETDNLFGDEQTPQVVLVGTSNSESTYNFDGALKQYLSADILNVAATGGGYDGAMLQYLPSEDFQQTPPKILIWEFEPHYNLSQSMFFRRALPLIENGCENKEALLTQTSPLKAGKNQVLFNGANGVLPISSGKYVIDLKYDNPEARQLKGIVWYMNGRKENLNIDVSSYITTQGRFVFELRDDAEWKNLTFLSLELELPENLPEGTKVNAKLCSGTEHLVAK